MCAEKYLIGSAALLQWALAAWAEVAPQTVLHPVDVGQDKDYRSDLGALPALADSGAIAFVVWAPSSSLCTASN
jgi:hypothetical protein